MEPNSRYPLAELKVDSVLAVLRSWPSCILPPENDALLRSALDELDSAMEELRAAHAELEAQNADLSEACNQVRQEHQRYVELFEKAPDGYVVTDLQGVVEEANLAAAELFDSARELMIGTPLALFVNGEDKRAYFQQLSSIGSLKSINDWEIRFQPWKGEPFWASVNIAKVQIPEHDSISLWWLIRDISKRRRSEDALRRYMLLAGHSRDIILFIRREDGGILEANAAAVKAYGYGYEDLLMLSIHDLRAPDTRSETVKQMMKAQADGILFETIHRRRDGSLFPVEVSSRGEVIGGVQTLVSVIRDISERRRAEELINARLNLLELATIHSTEDLLQGALDEIGRLTNSPMGFFHFLESDQKTISLQAWSTRTVQEFCGAKGKGAHYPIEKAGVWADSIRERGPVIHNDYSALPDRKGLPEGHPPIVRELVVPVIRSDRIVAILGVGNKPDDYTPEDLRVATYVGDVAWEITRRKLAEDQLKKAYNDLKTTLESITDGFMSVDRKWRITYMNESGAKMLGLERNAAVGEVLWELFPKAVELEFYSLYQFAVESNRPVHFEEYYPSPLNKWWECHAYPSSEGLSVYFRDITERKLIEDTRLYLARCCWSSDEEFFQSLARYLGESLSMDFVCIDVLEDENLSAKTLAVYYDGKFEDNMTYTLRDTPCGQLVGRDVCCFPRDVRRLFPKDVVLQEMEAESYAGTTLRDVHGKPIGLIAVIGRRPLTGSRPVESVLQLVGARAAGELQRKQADDALRESEERFRTLFDNMAEGVALHEVVHDQGGRAVDYRIMSTNPAFEEHTGLKLEDVRGRLAGEVYGSGGAPFLDRYVRVAESGRTDCFETFFPPLNRHLRISATSPKKGQFVTVFEDITERKQMEEALRKSHDELDLLVGERTAELQKAGERLRSLAAELLNAGENERKIMAQEIHDGISSQLAAIKFHLEQTLCMEQGAAESTAIVKQTCTLLQGSIEETRRIMANLRPSILDDLGILPTIAWLCREFQSINPSIIPHFTFKINEEDIPDNIKTVIFRLLQEALTNISKYSRADRVGVSLRRTGAKIVFDVNDNGQGFSPRTVLSGKRAPGHGFGLRGMRERVELSGGKCAIRSAPGKGVSIRAEWSVKSRS